ncbi:Bm594 [Caenorhabditis elegans]|nr:Bm594 [Caenorhabditis elegans]CCU83348.1 Bm594 [Caenorhabditis elegans]|eukprot:NP_001294739.1 Uncharacterized protein CELE_Y44A6D.7 [Caenorhabditis elegans]
MQYISSGRLLTNLTASVSSLNRRPSLNFSTDHHHNLEIFVV